MNARELRIGNLINYRIQDNLDEKKDWFEVSEIDATDLAVLENNIDYDYQPIPLTEEWLVRFGFELQPMKHDLREWYFIEDGKFSMNNARGFWSHSPIYLEDVIGIKYIHQLQNLFYALTGKELELKN